MCDLYSLTKSQDAIRRITKAMRDRTGKLLPLPGIFPDQLAPVVRIAEGERELTTMRRGFPPRLGTAARLSPTSGTSPRPTDEGG